MAVTLDATLASAQDSDTRHPLVEILSKELTASIPFDGTLLDTSTVDEEHPAAITHSSGRLCTVFYYGPAAGVSGSRYLRLQITDADRMEFTTYDIALDSYEYINGLSLCELTDGTIGMAYVSTTLAYRHLKYRIIEIDGSAVSSGTIETFASVSAFATGPFVLTLVNDTYLLVYGKMSGSDYYLYKYTSSNFTTWTGPTQLSIGGLTSTLRKANPSLLQISTGDIWLWFDYLESTGPNGEELTNIYYSISADNGGTWAAAVKVTAYDDYTERGESPVAVQKIADSMTMAHTRYRGSLSMDSNTSGIPWTDANGVMFMHFDAAHRKLYVTIGNSHVGNKYLESIVKIDVDTWTVDQYWDSTTVPALPTIYTDNTHHVWSTIWTGSGQYVVMGNYDYNERMVSVLDGENDTITNYHFDAASTYGYDQNVDWTPLYDGVGLYLQGAQIDEINGRIWVIFCRASSYPDADWVQIGYLPLATVELQYSFTNVVLDTTTYSGSPGYYQLSNLFDRVTVLPADDLIMMNSFAKTTNANFKGRVTLWSLSTGALYKTFDYDLFPEFPYYGVIGAIYDNGKIYGGVALYQTSYGSQSDYRGLCVLDVVNETFSYYRPSYASIDDYFLMGFSMTDNNQLICCSPRSAGGYGEGYGIALFNLVDTTWTLYNNDSLPGMSPSDNNSYVKSIYDSYSDMVYVSNDTYYGGGYNEIIAFSLYGFLKQTQYYTGIYDSSWTWTDNGNLVQGILDYDMALCLDPDDQSIYGFWVHDDGTEQSIKWDKEGIDFDITDYVLRDEDITLHRSIDSNPNSLSFSVSHGHLFDVHNNKSLLTPYLKKGRKLVLRFGEKISGTDYWQNQGSFIVTEQSISYKRGDYPSMKITAEDKTVFWDQIEVVATAAYESVYPETIIEDIIEDNTDLESADFALPTFDNRSVLYYQWLDSDVRTAIDQVAERFGYYLRIDVDDKISARKIADDNTVDHVYSDVTKIINFTPDDKYSDFTNKVTVVGQEQTEIQVLYPEERVASLSGTVAYNTGKEDHVVWYSEDRSKTCKNPRLVVIQTSTSIAFELEGDIDEYLTDSNLDPDDDLRDKYSTITVDSPDLTPELIAALSGLVGSYFLPDLAPTLGQWTIRVGSYLTAFFIWAAMNILGATGNYQYEIWAEPAGKIKRSLQASANDLTHQAEMGFTIAKKIEDPLCYSVPDCQFVADWQLMTAQLQRKRVSFEKIAHLQDEDGDTIQIPHPYTGQTLTIFINELERVMQIGENGYFLDKIEGWVIS